MGVLTSRGFQLQPDVIGAQSRGLALRGQFQKQQALEQQLGQQKQQQQLAGQLLGGAQQRTPEQTDQAIAQLAVSNPDLAEQVRNQMGLNTQAKRDRAAFFASDLLRTPSDQRAAKIRQRAEALENPEDTLSLLGQSTEEQNTALRGFQILSLPIEQQLKIAEGGSLSGETAKTREFNNLIRIAQDPSSTDLEKNSARRELNDLAKVSTSAAERIAGDPGLSKDIAESQAEIRGAKEEAKLGAQLKFKPLITAAVKREENAAKQKGEVFTDLNRQEAALPGLKTVIGKLKVLSDEATFTLAGRAFDVVAKEVIGFATKGGTARDKMISIVSNQVLPLLRPIFGAQFTEREGDRLIAAFADVNSTPESRRGQLDSFLSQMERNIEAKRSELQGIENGARQQANDLSTQSDDELLSF